MKRSLILFFALFASLYTYAQSATPTTGALINWQDPSGVFAKTNLTNLATALQATGTLGGGTVTAVSVVTANGLSGTVSTATTTPAITLNSAFTGIAKGTSGAGFAAAIAADFPTLNQNTTGTAGNVIGTVAIANGGSGQVTQAAALTALTGSQTANYVLASNGTNASLQLLTTAMLPTGIPNANLINSGAINTVTGTTGTDVNWSTSSASLGGTATLNIPDAGASARGAVTVGAQTFAGQKTLATPILNGIVGNYLNVTGTTSTLTATKLIVKADCTANSITITLPAAPSAGTIYQILPKNISASNILTVTAGGTDKIYTNSLTSITIKSDGAITLYYDGALWLPSYN